MKGRDHKYGRVTVDGKGFHEDEPVIIFRAQDRFAMAAVVAYYQQCKIGGCDKEHLEAIKAAGLKISEWQDANRSLVKTPD
jgi:hypothetical protein